MNLKRRPALLCGVLLLSALFLAVFLHQREQAGSPSRHAPVGPAGSRSIGTSETSGVERLVDPANAPGAADKSESPKPDLRQEFHRRLDRLRRLVDQDGAYSLIYLASEGDREFMKAHGAEFRDEVLALCRERGGHWDPLARMLRDSLSRQDQEEIVKDWNEKLKALLGPSQGAPAQRADVVSRIIQDAAYPIGIRLGALMSFPGGSGDAKDPAVAAQALPLLDAVTEPLLRSFIYFRFLGTAEDRTFVSTDVVERALLAVTSGSEARGTTVEIISSLGVFIRERASDESLRQQQLRVEAALMSRLRQEAGRDSPDDIILGKIGYGMMTRGVIPSAEQDALGRELLAADRPSSVRQAGVCLLMPDLHEMQDDPAARGFFTNSRSFLLEVLRKDKDPGVVSSILFLLTQYRDSETHRLLSALAVEHPELRKSMDKYLDLHGVPEDK